MALIQRQVANPACSGKVKTLTVQLATWNTMQLCTSCKLSRSLKNGKMLKYNLKTTKLMLKQKKLCSLRRQ